MPLVQLERRGLVAVLTLDRPEARNAISPEVSVAIEAALDEVEPDPGIRVVVLTGAGPTFCAGADLRAIAAGRGLEIPTARGGFAGLVTRDFPKPLIAAVNGPALAGGFEIVLACDLAVAAEHAIFGIPEVKRGLIAGAGGLIRLAKRVSLAVALELAMTGDPIDARQALSLGLVNRVVPAAQVLDEALGLAERICEASPAAVRASRRMVREAVDLPEAQAWVRNHELSADVWRTGDPVEGATAFAEKRAPVWKST
ncbi:MAG: crotonase/enoyl-CoA hydratase family protein [Acidimicrobiia bacterium]|nr:crotonase/enoyl-CoA hydratase family protein [Acidimicrobiia bacterium]